MFFVNRLVEASPGYSRLLLRTGISGFATTLGTLATGISGFPQYLGLGGYSGLLVTSGSRASKVAATPGSLGLLVGYLKEPSIESGRHG